MIIDAFPSDEGDNSEQRGRLLAQALTATQVIEQYQFMGTEAGRLLFETAFCLEISGYAATAESLYQRALHIREQQLGPQHPDLAFVLINLANLYYDQGRYAEAEPLYQRALYIREQQLATENPQVVHLLVDLANLYRDEGKDTEAESLYQRVLRIFEQRLGPEHPDLVFSW
jgi:tetratricopeptide (TPR) repeat protein